MPANFTLLNVALHVLLFTFMGWLVVRWCLRDARQRAWSALLALGVAAVVPWWHNSNAGLPLPFASHSSESAAWRPDWKIEITTEKSAAETSLPDQEAQPEVGSAGAVTLQGILKILPSLWGGGTLILLVMHFAQTLWRIRDSARLRHLTEEERMSVPDGDKVPLLRVFTGESSPYVTGWPSGKIAVPSSAFQSYNRQQWCWMLRHEAEHLRSGDLTVVWLLGVVRAAFWWNPFAHALISAWTQAREEVCDAAACGDSPEPAAYAAFLVGAAGSPRATLSMAASRPARRLRARLHAILKGQPVCLSNGPVFWIGSGCVILLATSLVSCTGISNGRAQAADDTHTSPGIPPSQNVRHSPAVRQFLKDSQVYLTARWVEMDSRASSPAMDALPETSYSDPQFQLVMRALSQQKGVDLMTSPSITTRWGQEATVEVSQPVQLAGGAGQTDFLGVKLTTKVTLQGNQLRVDLAPDFSHLDGRSLPASMELIRSKPHRSSDGVLRPSEHALPLPAGYEVKHLRPKKTVIMDNGHTAPLFLGKYRPGKKLFLFVTAKVISPKGYPLGLKAALQHAKTSPPPKKQTFKPVNLRVQSFDVPRHATNEAALRKQGLLQADAPSPEVFRVSAVMTPTQVKVLTNGFQSTPATIAHEEWQKRVTKPEPVAYKLRPQDPQSAGTIKAVPDENGTTIDLEIKVETRHAPLNTMSSVTTAITVWDQQSVILTAQIKNDAGEEIIRTMIVTAGL